MELEETSELMNMFYDREFGVGNVFVPEDHEAICQLLREIFACKEENTIT